jgi:hypothetical protein
MQTLCFREALSLQIEVLVGGADSGVTNDPSGSGSLLLFQGWENGTLISRTKKANALDTISRPSERVIPEFRETTGKRDRRPVEILSIRSIP